MILVQNKQRKIKINTAFFKKRLKEILTIIGYPDFDISLIFVNDPTIHRYNKQYRHKDAPTDILSFPFYPFLKPGEKIRALHEDEKNLGDLIIAPVYTLKKEGLPLEKLEHYLVLLIIHGVCHLLGYDHITDHQFRTMRRKERFIAKKLGYT